MYNLKTVCVGISIDINEIKLIVSDNANNNFNLLYSTSIDNKSLYDEKQILDIKKLKHAIYELINDAQKYTELKIEKVLISFDDGIVKEFNINQIKTDFFTYKSPQKVFERINNAINVWNKNINSEILWWEVYSWIDEQTKQKIQTNEIVIGSRYLAKINVYTTNNLLVNQFINLINDLNIKVLNTTICSLNASVITNNEESIVLEIYNDYSQLLYLKNGILENKKHFSFSNNEFYKYVANQIDTNLIDSHKIKNLLNDNLNTFFENNINLAFSIGDNFLDSNYVKSTILTNLVNNYASEIIQILEKEISFKKINKFLILCKSKPLVNSLIDKLYKITNPPNQIIYSNNNLLLLDNKYYSLALGIIQFYRKHSIYKIDNSCVQPYYSNTYDKKIEIKLATMAINNNITKTVQKIIK
ncbi:MPN316 family protein [Mycoplasmoides pirum]|uniref:MPN316 family protein n=1 Tax=Mycoplasmoides pirum TaxID=2122 RepID=UPI000483D889|nr:hypothetical protein [Mycoplasmoides pirum]